MSEHPAHACTDYASDGPNCQAPPRVADDPVDLACTDGTVRRFDAGSGARSNRIDLGSPLFVAPLIVGDRLWAALRSGQIVCARL